VWGTSSEADNVTWGCSGEDTLLFDDPDVPSVFDGTVFDSLFDGTEPAPDTTVPQDPPPAILDTTTSQTTTVLAPVTTILGGAF